MDRGSELAAYGVVDEEVAGGVDVAEQLRDTGHEGERVVVATAQTDIRDEQDRDPEDHTRNGAHDEQNGTANQHPRQSYVTHDHGSRRRLFSPRCQFGEFRDSDDGAHDDNEAEGPWKCYAIDVTVQRVDYFLVEEIKLAGVHLWICGIRSWIKYASDMPSSRNYEESTKDEKESDEDDDERGLCLKDVLRSERADHTEASLASDHHRHKTGSPVEAVQYQHVIVHGEL